MSKVDYPAQKHTELLSRVNGRFCSLDNAKTSLAEPPNQVYCIELMWQVHSFNLVASAFAKAIRYRCIYVKSGRPHSHMLRTSVFANCGAPWGLSKAAALSTAGRCSHVVWNQVIVSATDFCVWILHVVCASTIESAIEDAEGYA